MAVVSRKDLPFMLGKEKKRRRGKGVLLKTKRDYAEQRLHIAVAQKLRFESLPGVVHFFVDNGGPMSPKRGALRKAMGVIPGVSDFVFLVRGRACFLELKGGETKGQSVHQKAFQIRVERAGGLYEVARNIDEAIGILRAWGALSAEEDRFESSRAEAVRKSASARAA